MVTKYHCKRQIFYSPNYSCRVKDTIFGAAQTKLGSSYFVRALGKDNIAVQGERVIQKWQ